MGKALYRKYRSKSLDEIVGQPHITTTLGNALKSGAISHAYLFTGPRGVGKTSIARILAHEVNELPYSDDSIHLDIIEIDAASNRRIDEIRELRERVHTAPTSAKYKVYIIDEVHMLTKEAFNALLKTLEEPPAHVIFILATTEAHKLPETIISRTQRFTFKPVDETQVIDHLKFIAKEEGAHISDEALQLIARHGGGSFRDSISLLDQVRGHSTSVGLQEVQTMLGIAPDQTIDALVSVLQSGDPSDLVKLLQLLREQGYQAGQLAKQLAARLRSYLLEGSSPIPAELLTETLQKLLAVPTAHDQEAALELALLNIILLRSSTTLSATETIPKVEKQAEAIVTKPIEEPKVRKQTQKPAEDEVVLEEQTTQKKPTKKPASGEAINEALWDEALQTIKQTHNTLYSVARMATPLIEGDEITLVFGFAFHQKRLNETKNKQVISDIVEKIAGRPVIITCIVGKTTPAKAAVITPAVAATTTSDHVSTISNIFGGAEVLES
jgi:DNA polymerase III subunit gamma/tau